MTELFLVPVSDMLTMFLQVGDEDSGDEEATRKVAMKKYEEFKATCGDLLDPSKSGYL